MDGMTCTCRTAYPRHRGAKVSFTAEEIDYINAQPLARLSTVADDGQPDVTAVIFDFDGTHFFIGGFNPTNTRRARNVRHGNPKVALIIDDLLTTTPWRPRFVRIYGTAVLIARQGQEILEITPTVSWSSNISGAWTGSDGGQNPTLKTIHIDAHD
jgi:pyridoxamine 5'-phosphate oxidase family protein